MELREQLLNALPAFAPNPREKEYDPKWFSIVHDTGLNLHVRVEPYDKKGSVRFSVYPPNTADRSSRTFKDYRIDITTEIYISLKKDVSRMMKELNRRMLIAAIASMAQVNEQRNERQRQLDEANESMKRAMTALGEDWEPHPHDFPSARREYNGLGGRGFELYQWYGGDYKLEIDHLTVEEIEKIAALIESFGPRTKEN